MTGRRRRWPGLAAFILGVWFLLGCGGQKNVKRTDCIGPVDWAVWEVPMTGTPVLVFPVHSEAAACSLRIYPVYRQRAIWEVHICGDGPTEDREMDYRLVDCPEGSPPSIGPKDLE